MALLAVGQLHVELFEAALRGDAAFLQLFELRIDFGQVAGELLAACARLLGQLRQPQCFDLQFVRAALRFGRFAARRDQALRRVGVGGFGAHQRGARFFGDQRLGAQLLLEVLDLLLARQQAGLLGILRIEAHAVRGDRMAALDVDRFARLQLVALRPAPLRSVGAVKQPCSQSASRAFWPASFRRSRSARRGSAPAPSGAPACRRAVEGQLGGRRVAAEGADHVQPR